MDRVSLSVSGPWGSEIIPSDLAPDQISTAARIFASVMSGEDELYGLISSDGQSSPSDAQRAAAVMLVERARRATIHAPIPEPINHHSIQEFISLKTTPRFGHYLSAREAYAAYELWVLSTGARPLGATYFHRTMSRFFERVRTSHSVSYVDVTFFQVPGKDDASVTATDRAPNCTTPGAAQFAGSIAAAVMAGEETLSITIRPEDGSNPEVAEGVRVACLMIEARARASVRTPSQAALSGAEAALALAEDALKGECATSPAGEDAFAALASIRDTLRAGLAPLHAAEGSGPAAA